MTIGECASHAPVLAAIGPCTSKGSGEQSLARELYPRLEEDWLLIADRNFYNWAGLVRRRGYRGRAAVAGESGPDPGAAGVPHGRLLPVRAGEPQGQGHRAAEDHRRGPGRGGPGSEKARYVRVIEYEVPDRAGDGKDELIALVTTITDLREAPAPALAAAYHERWEHETGKRAAQDLSPRAGEGSCGRSHRTW